MEKSINEVAENKAAKQEISYEQLKRIAVQYQQKCVALEERVRQSESLIIRLEYLLKVLSVADRFSPEFIKKCADEVEVLLTIKKEPETTETADNKETTETTETTGEKEG